MPREALQEAEPEAAADDAAVWDEIATEEKAEAAGPSDEDRQEEDRSEATDAGDSVSAGDDEPEGDQPSDQAAGDADQADVWADATPEQRAAYEAAQTKLKTQEHENSSNRQRLSFLQRQVNELSQTPSANVSHETKAADSADDKSAGNGKWDEFAQEYPEVAGPVSEKLSELQAIIDKQEKELSAIGGDRRQEALDEQYDAMVEEHPGYIELLTANREKFTPWLQAQPRHIREAFSRNQEYIVDAAEAADVVGRFKQHIGYEDDTGSGGPTEADERRASGNGNPKTALSGKRERQLRSSTTGKTTGPSAATGISADGDPETIWKQFDRMEANAGR